MVAEPALDWDALTEEATELLSAYIRVDTVNPPGNETRACEFLGAILDREGIPYRLFDPGDNRATLVATLPGDGTRGKPLILLNHTDVVPFEREHWSVDPLGGEVREGYIWGRGSADMKGMGVMELMTFLLHHRHGLPLRRDLTFIAVADEEAGSVYGVEFLEREHPELLDCAYVLNEGGRGSTQTLGVERPVMQIGVAEKIPFWVRLSTKGRPGHGSVPTADNAADRLVRALQRIQDWERPTAPTTELLAYFEALHEGGILDDAPSPELIERLSAQQPRLRALQSNTISVTTLQSGVKHNVIPAEATATLDCRLVPNSDPDAFLAELIAVIDDERVEVEVVLRTFGPSSPIDSELYEVMSRAVRNAVEDAVVAPWVSAGFTDSRVFRRLGYPAYGFVPMFVPPEEQALSHGNDERIPIESLRLGMQILHDTVRGICG